MQLNENLNTHDGIYGHVIIRDNNDNIIVDKDNMILKAGKQFIAAYILKNINALGGTNNNFANSSDFTNYSSYNKQILGVKFYKSDSVNYTDNSILTNSIEKLNESIAYEFGASSSKYFLKLSLTVSSDNSITVNSCSIYIGDGTNNNTEELFSKIRFDDIILQQNNSFKLDYYIYI